MDFSIAQQLLDLYASEVNDGLVGGLDSCWRNIMLDGKLLEEVDPCTFHVSRGCFVTLLHSNACVLHHLKYMLLHH